MISIILNCVYLPASQNLVEYGPVSVCVDASAWDGYTGGVLMASECKNSNLAIDHCVQVRSASIGIYMKGCLSRPVLVFILRGVSLGQYWYLC